jgi:hypothetical protein
MVVPDSYQNIVQASLLEQAVAGIASYDPTELDRAGLKINIFCQHLSSLPGERPLISYFR